MVQYTIIMNIEGLSPILSTIVNAAWEHDSLFTEEHLRAVRKRKEHFNLTCKQKMEVLVTTHQLATETLPNVPFINVGVVNISNEPTVIFASVDEMGQRDIALATLKKACENTECSTNGCSLLAEKYVSRDARKRTITQGRKV